MYKNFYMACIMVIYWIFIWCQKYYSAILCIIQVQYLLKKLRENIILVFIGILVVIMPFFELCNDVRNYFVNDVENKLVKVIMGLDRGTIRLTVGGFSSDHFNKSVCMDGVQLFVKCLYIYPYGTYFALNSKEFWFFMLQFLPFFPPFILLLYLHGSKFGPQISFL